MILVTNCLIALGVGAVMWLLLRDLWKDVQHRAQQQRDRQRKLYLLHDRARPNGKRVL